MIIFENSNYVVETGLSQFVEDMVVYLVKNKTTGVVEAEDQMLPKIIDYAEQLNEATSEIGDAVDLYPEPELTH